jgi:hypothetical protein|tara:strand:+ start:1253 stop:1543 length:291 start_codon:yes stop_codon:yes gene_type:complete
MSIKKKIARKKAIDKKKEAEKKLSSRLMMFDKIPEKCLACEEIFDKKSKDMAMSWHVTVREESVRLFCPNCWQKARDVINEYHGGGGHNGENSERD